MPTLYKSEYGTIYCVDGEKVCIKAYCPFCAPDDCLKANVWVQENVRHRCKEGGNLIASLTGMGPKDEKWSVTTVEKCGGEK